MNKKSGANKVADKLAALDLHSLTAEELKAEIRLSLERTKNMTADEIERDFEKALQDARTTAKKYNITQEDIDAEIRAVRAEKKSK